MRFLFWEMKSLPRSWSRNNVKLLSCWRLFREPVDAVHYLSKTHFPTLQIISATFSCKHVWRPGYSADSSFDADWLMNVEKLFYNSLLWSWEQEHHVFTAVRTALFRKTLVCVRVLTQKERSPFISRSSAQQQGRAPSLVCLAADPLAPSLSETALFEIDGITVLFSFCLYENHKQPNSAKAWICTRITLSCLGVCWRSHKNSFLKNSFLSSEIFILLKTNSLYVHGGKE